MANTNKAGHGSASCNGWWLEVEGSDDENCILYSEAQYLFPINILVVQRGGTTQNWGLQTGISDRVWFIWLLQCPLCLIVCYSHHWDLTTCAAHTSGSAWTWLTTVCVPTPFSVNFYILYTSTAFPCVLYIRCIYSPLNSPSQLPQRCMEPVAFSLLDKLASSWLK